MASYHVALALVAGAVIALSGCHLSQRGKHTPPAPPIGGDIPRELSKTILPTYRIEPPDILVIDALQVIPKPPYTLRAFDLLAVNVMGTLPDAPIEGQFPVEPGGAVNLGMPYGTVKVSGLSVEDAKAAIEKHLAQTLREPMVNVSLLQSAGKQQIAGEHLVGPDGNVNLGSYGSVPVVGLTLAQAKEVIEHHLKQFLEDPEVAVDVFAYNSKVYYVVTQGAGMGDSVSRFPVTGNETVLDAISNINGLTEVASKKIWIARPTPVAGEVQILPVDWNAITGQAQASTNYQVLPGDRVFIAEDKWVAFDTSLGKLLAPIERAMGFTLLGVNTASRLTGKVLLNRNGVGGFGGF